MQLRKYVCIITHCCRTSYKLTAAKTFNLDCNFEQPVHLFSGSFGRWTSLSRTSPSLPPILAKCLFEIVWSSTRKILFDAGKESGNICSVPEFRLDRKSTRLNSSH